MTNSGVARWTGGALSSSIYLAILASVQGKKAAETVAPAAVAAVVRLALDAVLIWELMLALVAVEHSLQPLR